MGEASFYRRPLPPDLIALSSAEGREIFKEALAEGGMEGYFPLAEQLHTQADPAFCGLGSLVVVLNALAIDPGRLWRGPWRWFGEEMLDCCSPLDEVRREGITLPRLACLARCNGARVKTFPADETTVTELRYYVRAASSAPSGTHVIAAYSRAALGQTGDGHYSPIGGYHRGRDMALMLDVARFKYPPHWAPIPLLWEAMQREDSLTGRPRGFFVLTRGEGTAPLCRVPDARDRAGSGVAWRDAWRGFCISLTEAAADAGGAPLDEALRAIRQRLSPEAAKGVVEISSPPAHGDPEERQRAIADLLGAIRDLPLFQAATRAGFEPLERAPAGVIAAESLCIALLAAPLRVRSRAPAALAASIAELSGPGALPPPLAAEVARVRAQIEAFEEDCCDPA